MAIVSREIPPLLAGREDKARIYKGVTCLRQMAFQAMEWSDINQCPLNKRNNSSKRLKWNSKDAASLKEYSLLLNIITIANFSLRKDP